MFFETLMTGDDQHGKGFGAVVRDVDLRTLSADQLAAIKRALYAHRVVVIKGQDLSTEEYIDFSYQVGEPQPYLQDNYHHPEYPLIFVSSNVEQNGQKLGVARTGGYWHSDTSFQAEPMPLTMLYPQIIPQVWRRSTLFVDMAEVYAALPAELQAPLDDARLLHSGRWRYKVREQDVGFDITDILRMIDDYAPPVPHPAVIEHPVTGERALYGSRGFSIGIDGMPAWQAENLLKAVFDFAEQPRFVRKVFWELGDVIVWDNRLLIHRSGRAENANGDVRDAAAKEEQTMMFRITLSDGYPLSN
ncbi:MAG: TauD/TfdA family dioxygenase [Gammaproteobacteria bacterium]|nr:MAG: TauD/TfdA family dioxygenase [Gammaproteobacteria bacterium]